MAPSEHARSDDASGPAALFGSPTGALAPPDPALDPYLDAFGRVVLRFGITRTRMQDVAKEARVDRTTVFRNVGPMEQLVQAYLAREVHRFLDETLTSLPLELGGVELMVEVVATALERARAHPVLAKAIEDLLEQVVAVIAPGLAMLAGIGFVAPVDADATAQWIARFGLTCLLVPPPGDLRDTVAAVLRPVLTPS